MTWQLVVVLLQRAVCDPLSVWPFFPRWVSHLITAKTKHALAHQPIPHREEGNMGEGDGERVGALGILPMIWGKCEKWRGGTWG